MLVIVRGKSTIGDIMPNDITESNLDKAFKLLAGRLELAQNEPVRLVVCGGSALIATGLRQRTTRDVDIVALIDSSQHLASPTRCRAFSSTPPNRSRATWDCSTTGSTTGRAGAKAAFTRWACRTALQPG